VRLFEPICRLQIKEVMIRKGEWQEKITSYLA
jgi:hypothetical protein